MRLFSNKQKADYTQTLQKGISYVRGLRGGITDDTGGREENIRRLMDEIETAASPTAESGLTGTSLISEITTGSGICIREAFFPSLMRKPAGHGGHGTYISTAILKHRSRYIRTCSPWSGTGSIS